MRRSSMLCAACTTVMLAVVGCASEGSTSDPVPNCGWDTSDTGGQLALSGYLTSTDLWLRAHPGEIPLPPKSQFWMGDCPNDGTNTAPPVDEAGDSHP